VPQELPGLWWYKPMENDKGAVLTQSINQHKKKIKAYNLTHIISLFLSLNLSELYFYYKKNEAYNNQTNYICERTTI